MPTYKVVKNGNREFWYNERAQLHREDGPAAIYTHGTKWWFINGNLHREDGPAEIASDGTKRWYQNGQLHNENGPAVIYSTGSQLWFIHGKRMSEEEFNNRNRNKRPHPLNGKTVIIDGVKYMQYDFNYFCGNDIVFPTRPSKPTMPSTKDSSVAIRAYADDLERYEKDKEKYNAEISDYNEKKRRRKEELKQQLMSDYKLNQVQFDVIWKKAWANSHACGIHEVVMYFDELYDLVMEFNRG